MTDRGVSVTVNYVMTLAIATLLLSGLVASTGSILDDRRDTATRAELEVVGQRLAANLQSADRLATADAETVEFTVDLPADAAGKQYRIGVEPSAGVSELVLTTEDPPVSVTVSFTNSTDVTASTVTGGQVRVVLEGGNLEVQPA